MYYEYVDIKYMGIRFNVLIFCTPNLPREELEERAITKINSVFEINSISIIEGRPN